MRRAGSGIAALAAVGCVAVGAGLVAGRALSDEPPATLDPVGGEQCSAVLEKGLPPAEEAEALTRCTNGGSLIQNAVQTLGPSIVGPSTTPPTCVERIGNATALAEQAEGRRDRLIIDSFGTARRQRIAIPAMPDLQGRNRSVEVAAEDYTHVFSGAESLLEAGLYVAELLPPDRQGFLAVDDPEFPSGNAGAVILWRKGAGQTQAIVIHSGDRNPTAFSSLPTLRVEAKALDTLIGSLIASRHPARLVPEAYGWAEQSSIALGTNCRLPVFAPFEVEVRRAKPSWFSSLFGNRYSRRVPKVTRVQNIESTAVSWEAIDRAQLTAGMTADAFAEVVADLRNQASKHSAAIRAALAPSTSGEQQAARLGALNEDVKSVLSEATAMLEGIEASRVYGTFHDTNVDPQALIRELQTMSLNLEEVAINELGPVLNPGDSGAQVASLWLPVSSASPPRTLTGCSLSMIERDIGTVSIPVALPQGQSPLTSRGLARFWFARAPGVSRQYRLQASLRLDVNDVRRLHHQAANHLLHSKYTKTCELRPSIESTSQAAGASGTLFMQSRARVEVWACGWFKYPCGVSLKGTKSCKKHVRTRLNGWGFQRKHELNPSVEGTSLRYEFREVGASGQSVTVNLEENALMDQVINATELMPVNSRFVGWDKRLWNAVELRGNSNLDESTACQIAAQIRAH